MKRRTFIKRIGAGMAAASVFPAIIPNSAFGSNDRITIGCIGVGSMGTSNMKQFFNQPDCRIVAVCDVDRKHRENAKALVDKTYQDTGCKMFHDHRDLLNEPGIDAVMIATPDHWHAIIAIEAARAGKDIYAEKPLAYTIKEGRAIVNAVRQNEVIWQTGSWQRSQQHFRFACELVRNGRIGKVELVRVGLPYGNGGADADTSIQDPPEYFDYERWLGPAPWRPYSPGRCHWHFRWVSDYSGGQLTDWAGHHCDIANWAMNTENKAPYKIEGKADFPPAENGLYDTPPSYYFECEYKEGFKMIVADSRQQPKGMGAHFIGDEGWIHVNRSGLWTKPEFLKRSVIRPDEVNLYKSENHYKNFLECVKSRKPTITPVEAAYHAILVGHLGNIAMKTGHSVEWDSEKEGFVGDDIANRYLMRPMRSPWRL